MSGQGFVDFLKDLRDDPRALDRYRRRDAGQLLFHARNEGYDFTAEDVASVMGPMEWVVVTEKDRQAMDGSSALWRRMWGKTHLDYFVEDVVGRFTDDELAGFARAAGTGEA
jgi:hypothetical protein